MERGSLYFDVKGKVRNGRPPKNESTKAKYRVRVIHSSDEVAVMAMERRDHIVRRV